MSAIGSAVLKALLVPDNRNYQMQLQQNRDTITNLKWVGTFQAGDKIDSKNLCIESNTLWTPIKRLVMGESRTTTFSFLSSTIDRSFDIISTYVHSDKTSDRIYCSNIVKDLVKAVDGLKAMQKTYKDDTQFRCSIDTVIEGVQGRLIELQEKFPMIIPSNLNVAEEEGETKIDFPVTNI
jgi:hypothetical protein